MADKIASPGARRSSARLLAVQALYEIELSGAAADAVLPDFLQERVADSLDGSKIVKPDRRLFERIVEGASKDAEALDTMVAGGLAEDWPLDRLELVLRVILRAGAFELAEARDVPARVVINEYVDIAHAFFSGKEPAMVNGVLDGLARTLRLEEFESPGAA